MPKQRSETFRPLLVTIPHSGERVPPEATWLHGLPEVLLMYDVDRYVDRLYEPALRELALPSVQTEWHRYAIDLNRFADDVDCDSVAGHKNASGRFSRGLHWVITTAGERLMSHPMPQAVHDTLVQKYFEPFHAEVRAALDVLRRQAARSSVVHAQFARDPARGPLSDHTDAQAVYHIDAHSMPSVGTREHRDPGERRADVVISDCNGKSCSTEFLNIVTDAYRSVGFTTAYNWPYMGGRVTEAYGRPDLGVHSIQVELNRALYMNEQTKQLNIAALATLQEKLKGALSQILRR
jgi:N-formylglutamate amidohydrolase